MLDNSILMTYSEPRSLGPLRVSCSLATVLLACVSHRPGPTPPTLSGTSKCIVNPMCDSSKAANGKATQHVECSCPPRFIVADTDKMIPKRIFQICVPDGCIAERVCSFLAATRMKDLQQEYATCEVSHLLDAYPPEHDNCASWKAAIPYSAELAARIPKEWIVGAPESSCSPVDGGP
jgi:hypothetical protein